MPILHGSLNCSNKSVWIFLASLTASSGLHTSVISRYPSSILAGSTSGVIFKKYSKNFLEYSPYIPIDGSTIIKSGHFLKASLTLIAE